MQCDICFRRVSSALPLPLNCPTCARNSVYELRIDIARALLAKEDAAKKVEAVDLEAQAHASTDTRVQSGAETKTAEVDAQAQPRAEAEGEAKAQTESSPCESDPPITSKETITTTDSTAASTASSTVAVEAATVTPTNADPSTTSPASRRLRLEQCVASRDRCIQKTEDLQINIDVLRKEIEQTKTLLAKRRASLSKRKAIIAAASKTLHDKKGSACKAVVRSTRRRRDSWDLLHKKTVDARVFLCREVAHLYELRCRRRKSTGGAIKDEYWAGGIPLIDLRDMNNAHPTHISTSLLYIAHILTLASHYLSLKLPAEITLPHHDHPTATILPPSASYTTAVTTTATLAMAAQSLGISNDTTHAPGSANSSVHAPSNPPSRPRPLSLTKKLSTLYKLDPAFYSLFLEGAVLLAYDLAWACRTQGMTTTITNWEDVCAVGRNLYCLLTASAAVESSLDPGSESALESESGSESEEELDVKSRQKTGAKTKPKTKLGPESEPEPEQSSSPSSASASTSQQNVASPSPYPLPGQLGHGTAHSFLCAPPATEFFRAWPLPPYLAVADRLKAWLVAEMTGAEWEVLGQEEYGASEEEDEEEERSACGSGSGSGRRDNRVVIDVGVERIKNKDRDKGWMRIKSRG